MPSSNPDRFGSSRVSKWVAYPIGGLDDLTDESHESIHGGFDTHLGCAAIDYGIDASIEIRQHMVGGRRTGASKKICTGRGHRQPGMSDEPCGNRMRRHPDSDLRPARGNSAG